jgi:hypothetical protein
MLLTLQKQLNTPMTPNLLFDIESTGLLRRGSTIHCIVTRNVDADDEPQVYDYRPECSIIQGVKTLEKANTLIGHNIIGYDIPLLLEQYPDFDPKGEIIDTLIMSRLFYPEARLRDRDYERRPVGMPQALYGRHSLEAWGYRLKCFKGDFGKHEGSFAEYTPEMLDYCIQDTTVTLKLYQLLARRINDYS